MGVKLSTEQIKTIKSPTSGRFTSGDREYYYVPYWFSPNVDGTWERMTLDELPADVRERMSSLKNHLKNIIP